MSLYQKYHAQINKWNWNRLILDCMNNLESDDDGNMIGSVYLGSLINPSGKFYMPFASSNVDSCKSCHGTGNNAHKVETCHICNGTGKRYVKDILQYPAAVIYFKESNTPLLSDFDGMYYPCNLCNGTGKVSTTCKQCGGLGSTEAYNDEIFWKVLDDVASKHGGYITSGEGDPCDSFFCISIEESSQEEEGNNNEL